jgi:hypothetical protein
MNNSTKSITSLDRVGDKRIKFKFAVAVEFSSSLIIMLFITVTYSPEVNIMN